MARLMVVLSSLFLVVSSANQHGKMLLQLLQERHHRIAQPYSMAAQATLAALDTDHSGKVERRELEAFAKDEGLSVADVEAEFADLDKDRDGELSMSEIMGTLEGDGNSAGKSETLAKPASLPDATPLAPTVVRTAQEDKLFDSNLNPADTRLATSGLRSGPTSDKFAMAPPAGLFTKIGTENAHEVPVELQPTPVHSSELAIRTDSAHMSAEDTLEEHEIMEKVKHDAGNIIAQTFARTVASTLRDETANEKKASVLEASARSLRGQAETVAQNAQERTTLAASEAANEIRKVAKIRVHSLDLRAKDLESQASEHHQRALAAMDKVAVAQAEMRRAMMQA